MYQPHTLPQLVSVQMVQPSSRVWLDQQLHVCSHTHFHYLKIKFSQPIKYNKWTHSANTIVSQDN